MKIDVLTLFPEIFTPLKSSILGRAVDAGILEINIINIRDFSKDKHKKCDDYPFGGGAGMLMTVQPLFDAINFALGNENVDDNGDENCVNEGANKCAKDCLSGDLDDGLEKGVENCVDNVDTLKNIKIKTPENCKIIFPSPIGKTFDSKKSESLSKFDHLIFVCGHYEGVDDRIFQLFDIEQISLGDFVLTGGEIPAMAMIDSLSRFVDGVIAKESLEYESFSNGLLEYPQYTRPAEFMGLKVPDVLLSGNHGQVDKWRENQSIERTKLLRSDLLSSNKNNK